MKAKDIDVIVVGSCVQDLVSYAPRFPRPGESVRGRSFAMAFGGKGANQAVQAAKLGAKVAFVGGVGDDMFGLNTIDNMKRHGINCDHLQLKENVSTGTATITVSDDGENSIVIVPGANDAITVEQVLAAEDLISRSKVLIVQLEVPYDVNIEALTLARKYNTTTIFNPAPGIEALDTSILKLCDYVTPNENEAEFLSGNAAGSLSTIDDAKQMARQMQAKSAQSVIVTLGTLGCLLTKSDGTSKHIQCPKIKAKDTTGAGDSFNGAFSFYLATRPDIDLSEMVSRSACIASYSVQYEGTQKSYGNWEQLPNELFK